jgi:hypothetical protein
MSTESRLREVIDTGQQVKITFSNDKPHHGETVQEAVGRILSTNSPDVIDFQPVEGPPVPIPVSRILLID